jgi:hypothetical protein
MSLSLAIPKVARVFGSIGPDKVALRVKRTKEVHNEQGKKISRNNIYITKKGM